MELNSFWLHAKADPDHIAIIDSEGSERTAGEVLPGARCPSQRRRDPQPWIEAKEK